ncbi:membrane protein insertion efficiency factor YidD [Desulfuromonas soudanensis]|uniref:membrane protein insertion efficiency factor YidD n=1 Tax=Desulfuromonas soudanensis TaxID=1603606 RepID=UPI0009E86AD8|nr:membrane protein insertion efficiency factor YidD [Desulfuromonas soudanensis]
MIKRFTILLILFYQKFLSPLKGPSCRFYPSCSCYTLQAIEKYGVGSGILKGIARLCRCHPWHPGGFDPLS